MNQQEFFFECESKKKYVPTGKMSLSWVRLKPYENNSLLINKQRGMGMKKVKNYVSKTSKIVIVLAFRQTKTNRNKYI